MNLLIGRLSASRFLRGIGGRRSRLSRVAFFKLHLDTAKDCRVIHVFTFSFLDLSLRLVSVFLYQLIRIAAYFVWRRCVLCRIALNTRLVKVVSRDLLTVGPFVPVGINSGETSLHQFQRFETGEHPSQRIAAARLWPTRWPPSSTTKRIAPIPRHRQRPALLPKLRVKLLVVRRLMVRVQSPLALRRLDAFNLRTDENLIFLRRLQRIANADRGGRHLQLDDVECVFGKQAALHAPLDGAEDDDHESGLEMALRDFGRDNEGRASFF